MFKDLVRRLAITGICAQLEDHGLTFRFASPGGPTLTLARPLPHPCLPEHELTEIGVVEDLPEYASLVQVNTRMRRLIANHAPEGLSEKGFAELKARLSHFFGALLSSAETDRPPYGLTVMRPFGRVLFSGRTVLSPGIDLRIDQLGLAEDIAWTLFGPLVVRELGDTEEVQKRGQKATEVLDRIMAQSWVLLNRAPTIMPTSILAFHPVRIPDRVIRLHPLVCPLMNADYDGDQAAVFLPVTEAGQREAGEKLSVVGHLRRDPGLIGPLVFRNDMLWGLAELSLRSDGLAEVSRLAGTQVGAPEGYLTRPALIDAMRTLLEREGPEAALGALERLMRRGFEVAQESGASISPFIGASLERPPEPETDDPEAWDAYAAELTERIASRTDFDNLDLGPQLLAVKCGARGNMRQLRWLVGSRGLVIDTADRPIVPIRHGLRDGLTPRELFACVIGARKGMGQTALECARMGYALREAARPKGFNVLARAMRAKRPGVVFANAAATGEVDPLTDIDSRLFVGLPVSPKR